MSPRPRDALGRLTYANVTATLALFISLGGASYAAIALPAGSVGPRQLRAGAVTPGALGFPLGVAGVTDRRVEAVARGHCNGGLALKPGEPAPPCTPPPSGYPIAGSDVRLRLRERGSVSISAIAGVKDEGAPPGGARVTVGIVLDGRVVESAEAVLDGGQATEVPAQYLHDVPAGVHTIAVTDGFEYSSPGSGDILVGPVSVIAAALPSRGG